MKSSDINMNNNLIVVLIADEFKHIMLIEC